MAFKKKQPEPERPKMTKVGALWTGEGKNGKFLSGRIKLGEGEDEIRILVFKNDYKQEEKHPDYVIMMPALETNGREEAGKKFKATDEDLPFGL